MFSSMFDFILFTKIELMVIARKVSCYTTKSHNVFTTTDITFVVHITNESTINGISIIKIAETPGLGMNADKVLVPQFVDKAAGALTVAKNGQVTDANSQIEAISGATITSRAITDGVNAAVSYFENVLKGGQ